MFISWKNCWASERLMKTSHFGLYSMPLTPVFTTITQTVYGYPSNENQTICHVQYSVYRYRRQIRDLLCFRRVHGWDHKYGLGWGNNHFCIHKHHFQFDSQRLINSNLTSSYYITQYEELAFHSFLRWKMIIYTTNFHYLTYTLLLKAC